jgi:hypothetical protein
MDLASTVQAKRFVGERRSAAIAYVRASAVRSAL